MLNLLEVNADDGDDNGDNAGNNTNNYITERYRKNLSKFCVQRCKLPTLDMKDRSHAHTFSHHLFFIIFSRIFGVCRANFSCSIHRTLFSFTSAIQPARWQASIYNGNCVSLAAEVFAIEWHEIALYVISYQGKGERRWERKQITAITFDSLSSHTTMYTIYIYYGAIVCVCVCVWIRQAIHIFHWQLFLDTLALYMQQHKSH